MAIGLYMMQDGSVMVAYGQRRIPISCAEYKANGYKPALEKLAMKSRSQTSRKSAPGRRAPEAVDWPAKLKGGRS